MGVIGDETRFPPKPGKFPVVPRNGRQSRQVEQHYKLVRRVEQDDPGQIGRTSRVNHVRVHRKETTARTTVGEPTGLRYPSRNDSPSSWRGRDNGGPPPRSDDFRPYGRRFGLSGTRSPPGRGNYPYRSSSTESYTNSESQGRGQPRSYYPCDGQGQRTFYPSGNREPRSITPPFRSRGRCIECGQPGCHSDFHGGVMRDPDRGCHVCGALHCHSDFHRG